MRTLIEMGFVAAVVMALGCEGRRGDLPAGALIQGEKGISSIANDGFFLFWTREDGAVNKAGVDGGGVTALVPPSDPPVAADHIAVNGGHVFWTSAEGEGTTLKQISKKGGKPEAVVSEKGIIAVVAVGGHVCWMTGDESVKCKEVELGDTVPPDVVSPAGPMAIHAGTLFFAKG
ncbi:MAG: hypothetical protein ABI193_24740, partial [Minicystis sp.]